MTNEFTRHARNRMRRLRLTQEEVTSIIASHEWHEEEEEGHKHIGWVRYQGEYLKVVYAIEGEVQVVITVGVRTRLPEGLR